TWPMGNSKSRQANPAGQTRKQAKHASRNINISSSSNTTTNNINNNNNGISPHDTFSSQPIANDSGIYSIHGSATVAPAFPGGAFHNNLSSPSRLNQQKKTSDSSLRLQYGSRVKRATVLGPGPPPDTDYPINGSSISNEVKNNSQRIRSSGLPPRAATAMSTGDLNRGIPEMSYQHHQQLRDTDQLQQQLRASPISMRPSQGRNSAVASPSPAHNQQRYSTSLNYQPHTQYHSQPIQQQQQQQQRVSVVSPAPINGHRDREEESKVSKRNQLPSDFMDIPPHQRPSSFQNGYGHQGGPNQPSNSYQPSPLQQQPLRKSKVDGRIRNDYNYTNNNNVNSNTLNYNTDSSNLYVTAMESVPLNKTADMLAQAGPLIDNNSIMANKSLAVDQVFARLAKQYPTNPRETDKRERIYRWLDDVANALTFNPDTDIPGWVIPVTPDELDPPAR
ncbi:hypothetical protein EC991_010684, partial [Linnemannia zychae]